MTDPMKTYDTSALRRYLLDRRGPDGYFESRLSDSAISTAVACVALELADAERYADRIDAARKWLVAHCDDNGLYGDSPESPANLTATFLAYIALQRHDAYRAETQRAGQWLEKHFGDFSPANVRNGLLAAYGKDLTFSVPILALATAAGFFPDAQQAWRAMPRFPFELVLLPERLFKYLNLPVVSYAIPALICVGLAQLRFARAGLAKSIRSLAKARALAVLLAKQPEEGGFLEAAPLTGFCLVCLCAAGLKEHPAARRARDFLANTQGENGAWPIDRDLRQWTTSLAVSALAPSFSSDERLSCCDAIKARQTRNVHPFTRSAPGGWAWTTHAGGVPDADDTPAAIIALHRLGEPASDPILNGIRWLLQLQNRDGGMPTFCRGWSGLPFDRSCPDLAAHAFKALTCYEDALPKSLKTKVARAKRRLIAYLEKAQRADGAFLPLWFGDQNSPSKEAPVYGAAVVLEHLKGVDMPFLRKTKEFLVASQHDTGGWGSLDSSRDYVTVTARAVAALAPFDDARDAVTRGRAFLAPYLARPESIPPEPIGLYFAHLWYSEELYAPIFLAKAFSSDVEPTARREGAVS